MSMLFLTAGDRGLFCKFLIIELMFTTLALAFFFVVAKTGIVVWAVTADKRDDNLRVM